ncbi:hypothetical protein BCV73_00615 [Paenibacillus sp. SSG-1]|uniref:GNAT family N-acetyltransferase n=1 Tax=Paenibacillus sp. SSG-1 TaxID=1443669 RepID=UPI000B7CF04F|nr:GNAT family N-acetyltransferase [Paenibacillus sp. SSG-1]OXL81737.1 hypothetical protein BCV73_00615 [Paenibacillus sp. SSG-1]
MKHNQLIVKHNICPDKELIKKFISSFLGEDQYSVQYFMRGLNSQFNLFTYEAIVDGSIVGLVTAWHNKFHPYCTYLSTVVNPLHQQQVETILLQHVESFEGIKFPLQTSIWETSLRLKDFYENKGFVEIRRTYTPKLKTSSIPIHDLNNFFISKDSPTVISIKEILHDEKFKERLIILIRDNYQKTHKVNPLGIHDVDYWRNMVFAEDLILDASYVVLKRNEVQAFALLHYSDAPNEVEFGWRGTTEDSDIHLILWLTAYQIDFARDHGYEYIAGEIDTTDPYSLEILKAFPFSPSPALITYQKQNFSNN